MTSLPRALALSLAQLGDPAILKVLTKSAAITLAIFVALGYAASFGVEAVLAELGILNTGGVGTLLTALVTLLAGWLLFRFVALAVIQFFADDVVRAVEARHYPHHAAQARKLPFHEELANSVKATTRAVLVNLVALPFALVLPVTGAGTALLFWLVNAVLLGREFQDMVWLRHRADAQDKAPISSTDRFLLGGLVAALLAIPFVNLLAPVIGAASATHMVHRARAEVRHA